jgi:TPR repeat protein
MRKILPIFVIIFVIIYYLPIDWKRKESLSIPLGNIVQEKPCNENAALADDRCETIKLWRKSAEQGDAALQAKLGWSYLLGINGLPKNEAEGIKWYLKAAELGNQGAQFALGYAYKIGRGVAKDEIEAIKWLNLSVTQNDDSYAKIELEDLEKTATQEQINEGKRKASEWRKAHQ